MHGPRYVLSVYFSENIANIVDDLSWKCPNDMLTEFRIRETFHTFAGVVSNFVSESCTQYLSIPRTLLFC